MYYNFYLFVVIAFKSMMIYYTQLGLGTELGTFKGTYRIASPLPSTDSQ